MSSPACPDRIVCSVFKEVDPLSLGIEWQLFSTLSRFVNGDSLPRLTECSLFPDTDAPSEGLLLDSGRLSTSAEPLVLSLYFVSSVVVVPLHKMFLNMQSLDR